MGEKKKKKKKGKTLSQYLGWHGRVAQAVEHLPSKHYAMSSNASTTKNKTKISLIRIVSPQFQMLQ
jgi:hypothetical protein